MKIKFLYFCFRALTYNLMSNRNKPNYFKSTMINKLTFKIGDESLPTVMNDSELKASPFADAINLGLKKLEDAIFDANIDSNRKTIHEIYPNKIFSFLGERGSGKTSCLLTTVELLKTRRTADGRSMQEYLAFMPVVDPSFFDNTHNILDIFIGELYHLYQNECKLYRTLPTDKRNRLKSLQTKFKAAKKAIYFLNSREQEKPIDEMEELGRLSDGVELNRIMRELVDEYLKYHNKKTLIVCIDDLDLNIREAYDMMEQIRKYLILPNVVIMLAAKHQQLLQAVCLSLTDHFEPILNHHITKEEIVGMAERYLEKLLPTAQRIYMPEPENFMQSKLEIINGDVSEPFESVEFAVLSLIFQKTGFLFYNHDGETSLIVPRNLRELRHLTTALIRMKSLDEDEGAAHKSNKEQFRQYFREQWMETLTLKQHRIAETILNESNIGKLNKLVVSCLYELSPHLQKWLNTLDDSGASNQTIIRQHKLKEIVNPANNPDNVSIGDVMMLLDLIRKFEDSQDSRRLLFFIMTHYSMLLYELYDDMTCKELLDDNGFKVKQESTSSIPLLRNNNIADYPNYFNLIGGSFFTLSGKTFIPHLRESRELVKINGWVLVQEVKRLIEEDQKGKHEPLFDERLRLVEFFILTLRRHLYIKDGGNYDPEVSDNWRLETATQRFEPFNHAKNILFDVTAPFVNMIYPRYAYDRFNNKLYDVALKYDCSLLNQILSTGRRYPDGNRFADLMSRMAIRNMEVLQDMHLWLSDRRRENRPDGQDEIGSLINFFKLFNRYSVKTYDRESDNNDFLTITYAPIALLGELLEDVAKDNTINSLFNKIFESVDTLMVGASYSKDDLKVIISQIADTDTLSLVNHLDEIFGDRLVLEAEEYVRALTNYPLIDQSIFDALFDNTLKDIYRNTILVKSNGKVEEAKDNEKKATQELTAIKDEMKRFEQKLTLLRERHDSQSEQKSKISAHIVKLEYDIKNLSEQRNILQQKIGQLEKTIGELESNQENIKSSLSTDQTLHNSLLKQIGEWENRLDNPLSLSRKEIESFARTREDLIQQAFTLKSKIDINDKQFSEISKRIQKLQEEIKHAHEVKSESEYKLPELVSRLDEQKGKEKALRNEIDSIISMQNDVLKTITKLSGSVDEAEIKLSETHNQLLKARSAYRSLIGKLNQL